MGLRIKDLDALVAGNILTTMLIPIGNAGAAVDDKKALLSEFITFLATQLNTTTLALTKVSIDASAANNHITELDTNDMKAAAGILMSQLANLTTANRVVVSSAANKIESSGTITTAMLGFLNVTAGTLAASKALVVDAAKKINELEIAGNFTQSGAGIWVNSTTTDHYDDSGAPGVPGGNITAATFKSIITTGAGAYTPSLANGTEGQFKWIRLHVTGGGSAKVTPVSFGHAGGVDLNTVGDNVLLYYHSAKWYVVGGHGHVVG